MKDLISREALLKRLDKVCVTDDCFGMGVQFGIDSAKDFVAEAPAADAVEVSHAKWVRPTKINGRNFDIPHCSACGEIPCDEGNYCHNCGADMRERKEQ